MLSAELGVKFVWSTKQQTDPIGLEEERRAEPHTPVAITYTLGEHSSQQRSHIKRHNPERAPWGGRG